MAEKLLRDRLKVPAFKASSVNMYMHDGTVDLRNVNGLLEDMAAEIRRLRKRVHDGQSPLEQDCPECGKPYVDCPRKEVDCYHRQGTAARQQEET